MNVIKNETKSIREESRELGAMMASKPQTDQMVDFYKNNLIINEETYESLKLRISVGHTVVKHLVFGLIPIKSKKILDSLGISRLKMEMNDISNTVFNNKQYYQSWLDRKKDYDLRMDGVIRECNDNFEAVLKKAKAVTTNPQLPQVIKDYKNPNNDQEMKVQFYLYIKLQVNNSEVHGKKK